MGCGCKLTGEELAKLLSDAIAAGGPEAQKLLSSLKGGIETATKQVEPEVVPPHLQNIPKDKLWGSIVDTVYFIAETGKDLLEKLIAATSAAKALEQFIEAIPVVGEFLSTIPGTANWALTAAKGAFEAHDSISVRDALSCNIFCIMRSGTEFSYEAFMDAMEEVLNKGYADIPSAITDISFILAGVTPPQATWEVVMSAIGHILKFGGSVLGLDLPKLILSLNAGIADDDYLLCDCYVDCETTTILNYSQQTKDSLVIANATTTQWSIASSALPKPQDAIWSQFDDTPYRLGTDIVVNYNGANRAVSTFVVNLPSAKKICSVRVKARHWGSTGPGSLWCYIGDSSGYVKHSNYSTYATTPQDKTFFFDATGSFILFYVDKLYTGAKAAIEEIEINWDALP